MMVVPSKRMAVVVFSPRLDAVGNSARGVEVCKRLVNEFGLHPYRGMTAGRVAAHQIGGQMNEADKRAEAASAADRALGGVARAGSGGVTVNAADAAKAGAAGRRMGQPGQHL
jgi:glutaminase